MADDLVRSSFFNPTTNAILTVEEVTNEMNDEADMNDNESASDTEMNEINIMTNNKRRASIRRASVTMSKPAFDDQVKNAAENKVMNELIYIMLSRFEELVAKGSLAPSFLTKMTNDPQQIVKFIRQNRAVVGNQLNRRLNPSIRPTREQLEARGIVPKGYFTNDHEKAMKVKHRRKSSAAQDLSGMIALRPSPQDLVNRGIIAKSDMHYETNDVVNDNMNMNDNNNNINNPITITLTSPPHEGGDVSGPWEISILSTLLFKTISFALRRSCLDTQKSEAQVLTEMEEMNTEMRTLRDALDKFFFNDEPDVLLFSKEEEMIREKFHGIQKKLFAISAKQNAIHEKLRILHKVEHSMVALQNSYDMQLGKFKKDEECVLRDLKEQRIRRNRAMKVMSAEKSHCNWAMAKLDYAISISKTSSIDSDFVSDLNGFLDELRSISENQKDVVSDFDFAIEKLESHLLTIRRQMGTVRSQTYKKIYELHKQVEIAETLELGNRRLSVGSPHEIENETRHHRTKIQRQLDTLDDQVTSFNYDSHERNLREIMDCEIAMSQPKLKCFFGVFVQTFSQTICDIQICYKNLKCIVFNEESKENSKLESGDAQYTVVHSNNSDVDSDEDYYNHQRRNMKLEADKRNKEKMKKMKLLCLELYGIKSILNEISNKNKMTLPEKIIHCMKFIQIMQNALLFEMNLNVQIGSSMNSNENEIALRIANHRIGEVNVMIARKLIVSHYVMEEIDRSQDEHIPRLAQVRTKHIFEVLLKSIDLSKMFPKYPKNAHQCAKYILKRVFDINYKDTNLHNWS